MSWTNPTSPSSGADLTVAFWDAQVKNNLKAIGDPMGSFTTTLGNWTQGNGTLDATYLQAGKLVRFRIKFVFGSTSVASGGPTFTLPVAAVDSRCLDASVTFFDTSAGLSGYMGGFAFNSTTTGILVRTDASASLSSTVPFTWATGDELVIVGAYEAA